MTRYSRKLRNTLLLATIAVVATTLIAASAGTAEEKGFEIAARADRSDRGFGDSLVELEMLTNPRVRQEVGEISLVPPEERVSGAGASWVMAPFTHIGWPSRFSDGS